MQSRRPNGRFIALALVISLCLAAGCRTVPGASPPPVAGDAAGTPETEAVPAPPLTAPPPAVARAVHESGASGEPVRMALAVAAGEKVTAVHAAVARLGGTVIFSQDDLGYLQVEMPPEMVDDLVQAASLSAMEPDFPVQAPRMAATRAVATSAVRSGFLSNVNAIGSAPLTQATGATGEGVTIAVIDTGVDPGHPDLQRTSDGQPKIVDWKDFTHEGDVRTSLPAAVKNGVVKVVSAEPRLTTLTYGARGVRSLSGNGWFGLVREAAIRRAGLPGHDLDHNGAYTDQYGVLVVDSRQPGRYDLVYVDTNRNLDFSDETPLRVFRESQDRAYFGFDRSSTQTDDRTAFVVADLAADGRAVSLGFEGNWHGTHVASIAAANGPDGLQGVAPGARIMALKALNSDGIGTGLTITEALFYAAEHGADVINISVNYLENATGIAQSIRVLSEVVSKYNVVVVLAAGNNGPGMSSATAAGDPARVLTVGGYYSPAMWERDHGYRLPGEMVWDMSGAGPRPDGGLAPQLIAPAAAPAAVPRWAYATGYALAEGTSQAVPHVAGAAALLIDAARRAGINTDYRVIKGALEKGARLLDGFYPFEQGFGLINVNQAWNYLQKQRTPAQVTVSGPVRRGQGLLARDQMVGSMEFTVANSGPETRLNVVSAAPWMTPERRFLTLPPNASRTLRVNYTPPATPGIYSHFLTLVGSGYEVQVPNTLLVPYQFPDDGGLKLGAERLLAGRNHRYMFAVPEGTSRVDIRVAVPQDPGSNLPRGRIQFFLFDPDGRQVFRSRLMGRGPESLIQSFLLPVHNPTSGVWEVLVTSDPLMAQLSPDHPVSAYSLEIRRSGMAAAPVQSETPQTDSAPAGFVPRPLRFTYEEGGFTATEQVEVKGDFDTFTGAAVGAGLTEGLEVMEISNKESAVSTLEYDLTVDDTIPLARFEVFAAQPTAASLGLRISRYNPVTESLETFRAQSQVGSGSRVLEVRGLPPGKYIISVDASPTGERLTYFYRRIFFREEQAIRAKDTVRVHSPGDRWIVPLEIDVPKAPGRYHGQIMVRDTVHDLILGWVPVEISVGEPPLVARPLVPEMVVGQPGHFTLELLDMDNRPVSGTVLINGLSYRISDGRATVPVTAASATMPIVVEADLPNYAPFRREYTLWAGVRSGVVPVAPRAEEESRTWRQKVTSELEAAGR